MYEIVSDMSNRQDTVDERLSSLEDKVQSLQVILFAFSFSVYFSISQAINLSDCLVFGMNGLRSNVVENNKKKYVETK